MRGGDGVGGHVVLGAASRFAPGACSCRTCRTARGASRRPWRPASPAGRCARRRAAAAQYWLRIPIDASSLGRRATGVARAQEVAAHPSSGIESRLSSPKSKVSGGGMYAIREVLLLPGLVSRGRRALSAPPEKGERERADRVARTDTDQMLRRLIEPGRLVRPAAGWVGTERGCRIFLLSSRRLSRSLALSEAGFRRGGRVRSILASGDMCGWRLGVDRAQTGPAVPKGVPVYSRCIARTRERRGVRGKWEAGLWAGRPGCAAA